MAKIQDVDIPHLEFAEAAAPGTPASAIVRIYAKADGLLYSKDDAGTETLVSGGSGGLTDHNHTTGGDGGDLDAPVIDGYAIWNEEAAPSTPGAATVAVYAKSDGLMYSKDDAGVETLMSGGSGGGGTASENHLSGADVTLTNANQFYDGPSLSLAAGTYVVFGHVEVKPNGGNGWVTARLWDGTTDYDTSEGFCETDGGSLPLPLQATFTLGSTTTIKISAACSRAGATMKRSSDQQGGGNPAANLASGLVALKIA